MTEEEKHLLRILFTDEGWADRKAWAEREGLTGTTYYDRLRALADLRYDDTGEEQAFAYVMNRIDECRDRVHGYTQNNGFRSQEVRDAITRWADPFLTHLSKMCMDLETTHETVVQARERMRQASDLFKENVSEDLLTFAERAWKNTGGQIGIWFDNVRGIPKENTYWGRL